MITERFKDDMLEHLCHCDKELILDILNSLRLGEKITNRELNPEQKEYIRETCSWLLERL